MTNLTVISVVANNSGIVDYMINSIYKFTDPKPRIILCDNGNNGNTLDKYRDDDNIVIIKNDPTDKGESAKHARGLNKIFPLVKTEKTAIFDSDCMVLKSGWDQISAGFNMLTAEPALKAGEPFYYVCFMVFYTKMLEGINFMPSKDRRYMKPRKGYDTGWEVTEKTNPEEVERLSIRACWAGTTKIFDKSFNYKSFELWRNDEPLVAHLGHGSSKNRKQHNTGRWMKVADQFLKG